VNDPQANPADASVAGPDAAAAASGTAASSSGARRARRRAFLIFGAVLVIGAIAWGIYWLLFLNHYESTDDAYVAGDVLQITSEVAGTVSAVYVDDTQEVTAGQPLVQLDPIDARVAVANAEAALARTARDVSQLFTQDAQLRADLASREIALTQAKRDLERRQPLRADGAVSGEDIAHAADAVAAASAAVRAAQAQLDTVLAQTRGTSVATHPQVQQAAANFRSAALALQRTRLTAPTGGIIARRNVQIGERIAPGAPLLALVPLGDLWVEANFKEVQLRRVRIGQPVTFRADFYGSSVEFHGKVAGLSAGSGSAFALLPAQNASGNWIKIVQRVPIRIALDPKELAAHPLRIGLSANVEVDVADTSGPVVSTRVRGAPAPSFDYEEDPATEARIAQIINANSQPRAQSASGEGTAGGTARGGGTPARSRRLR
jgi:membrane fusion protein (multidrug efflux system)